MPAVSPTDQRGGDLRRRLLKAGGREWRITAPHPLALVVVLNVRAEVPRKSGQLGLEDRLCPRAVLRLPPPGRHLPSLGRLRQGNCVVAAVGPFPFAFMANFGCPRCVLAPTLAQRSPEIGRAHV